MIQKSALKYWLATVAVGLSIALLCIAPMQARAESIDHSVKCGVNFNLDGQGTCATTKSSCENNFKNSGDKQISDGEQKQCNALGNGAESDLENLIGIIVNVLSVLVGVVAVIMIIIGGFKYITSAGDSNKTASAKNTIIYAIVGVIIAALAQVIVRFVLNAAT